jgi:hypothetical protein
MENPKWRKLVNLEKLLDVHIAAVRKIVDSGLVPPHGDLMPMCVAFRDDGSLITATGVTLSPDHRMRRRQHEALVRWLKELGAAAYTWAAPAWGATIRIEELATLRGGVEARPDRQEIIACTVGDKHQTLSTELRVVRNNRGRIVELTANRVTDTATGLFHDLLLEAKQPVN